MRMRTRQCEQNATMQIRSRSSHNLQPMGTHPLCITTPIMKPLRITTPIMKPILADIYNTGNQRRLNDGPLPFNTDSAFGLLF